MIDEKLDDLLNLLQYLLEADPEVLSPTDPAIVPAITKPKGGTETDPVVLALIDRYQRAHKANDRDEVNRVLTAIMDKFQGMVISQVRKSSITKHLSKEEQDDLIQYIWKWIADKALPTFNPERGKFRNVLWSAIYLLGRGWVSNLFRKGVLGKTTGELPPEGGGEKVVGISTKPRRPEKEVIEFTDDEKGFIESMKEYLDDICTCPEHINTNVDDKGQKKEKFPFAVQPRSRKEGETKQEAVLRAQGNSVEMFRSYYGLGVPRMNSVALAAKYGIDGIAQHWHVHKRMWPAIRDWAGPGDAEVLKSVHDKLDILKGSKSHEKPIVEHPLSEMLGAIFPEA
jgi:hypothetical protein